MNRQHGMTLVELMIGLVLSLSVIAGVSSLFLHMKKSNQLQRAMATMADDSSYVQKLLKKEIRRAGGLRSSSDVTGTADQIFLARNAVLGSALDFSVSDHIKGDGSLPKPLNDAFVIRYQLLDDQDLSAGEGGNVSSPCTRNILLNTGEDPNTHVCLSNVYPLTCGEKPSLEAHVVSVYFYLDDDTNTLMCTAQRTLPALGATETCAKNCANPNTLDLVPSVSDDDKPVELISNVVKLAISYGVDDDDNDGVDSDVDGADADVEDGAANYYTEAAKIPANKWKDVISMRLSVVVRSEEDHLTDKKQVYSVEGVSYTATDYRLYKVFTTTIALRNKLL